MTGNDMASVIYLCHKGVPNAISVAGKYPGRTSCQITVITHQKFKISCFHRAFYPGSTTVSRISHGADRAFLLFSLFGFISGAGLAEATSKGPSFVAFFNLVSTRSAESPEGTLLP